MNFAVLGRGANYFNKAFESWENNGHFNFKSLSTNKLKKKAGL